MKSDVVRRIIYYLVILTVGYTMVQVIDAQRAAVEISRDYFLSFGTIETGAINLVSSIYLGYRAFDTLGETIVLFLGVSGTVFFMRSRN